MALFLPQRWRRRPSCAVGINWAHPLSQYLAAFCVFGDPYGAGREIVNGAQARYNGGASYGTTAEGSGTSIDGNGGSFTSFPVRNAIGESFRPYDILGDLTLFWMGVVRTATKGVFLNRNTGNGTNQSPFTFAVDSYTSNKIYLNRANTDYRAWVGQVVTTGTVKRYGVVQSGGIQNAPTFYDELSSITGSAATYTSGGTGAATAVTDPGNHFLNTGHRYDDGALMDGVTNVALAFSKALTPSEYALLYTETPWALLIPLPARRYFWAAGGAAPTVFIPIIGRGPGLQLAGGKGLAG